MRRLRQLLVAGLAAGALAGLAVGGVGGPARAAGASVAVAGVGGEARANAEAATTLTLTGSGFQAIEGGFGGIYVLFGAVSGDWRPSAGGVGGRDFLYVPDAQTKDNAGREKFVAFIGSETASSANGGVIAADGSWATTLVVPGAVFDVEDAAGQAQRVDCRQTQCGVITIGAHGVVNANNETFTPVSFDGATAATAAATAGAGDDGETAADGAGAGVVPATGVATLGVDATTAVAGHALAFTGRGFAPGEQVTAVLDDGVAAVGPLTAGQFGEVAAAIPLAADLRVGTHSLTLTGAASGASAEATFTVRRDPSLVEASEQASQSAAVGEGRQLGPWQIAVVVAAIVFVLVLVGSLAGAAATRRARRLALSLALATLAVGAGGPGAAWGSDPDEGGDIAVSVTIPGASQRDDSGNGSGDGSGNDTGDGARQTIVNAQLTWGFNLETRGKSYYGACNFLMAGRPGTDGDTGAAREWDPGNWGGDLYHAQSGNAQVVNAQGQSVPFERRCLDPAGQPVSYNASQQSASTYTDTQVKLTGGTGWRDTATGAAQITWDATFTVVYYDGLTYFWLEDPVITISASGQVELTATAGGFGMPREGGAWGRHPDTAVVLANGTTASGTAANAGGDGVVVRHAYADLAVAVPAGAPTQRLGGESSAPGAWPQSFVDFHGRTGLHSYWYSSGAAIDHRKPPDPVYVSWDAAKAIDAPVTTTNAGAGGASSGWLGGVAAAKAAAIQARAQGGADAGTGASNPWGSGLEPVVLSGATKDLVPVRGTAAGTWIAADAAILTLLVSASIALIAWRRGWFRLQPKGIVS